MGVVIPAVSPDLTSKQDLVDALSGHFVRDPLSEVTRKERRVLLATAAIGTVMVKANILPQRISALGIDFGEINKVVLLRSIALVSVYFLVAFFLYAVSDFLAWRIAIQNYLLENSMKAEDEPAPETFDTRRKMVFYQYRLQRLGCLAKPVSFFRATFEFLFPIVFAAYSIWVLFTAPS
jgi:hypothetical protein